jgi:hypothetical protein
MSIESLHADPRVVRVFEEMKRRAVSAPPHVKQRVWREWDRTVLQMIRFMRMGHNYHFQFFLSCCREFMRVGVFKVCFFEARRS